MNLNPNTVAKAYLELELKGIIASERGSGSFIQVQPPALAARAKEKKEKLENLYRRLLGDAASSGVTESELLTLSNKELRQYDYKIQTGEESPVWLVCVGDEKAEPVDTVYTCHNFAAAEKLAQASWHGLDATRSSQPAPAGKPFI